MFHSFQSKLLILLAALLIGIAPFGGVKPVSAAFERGVGTPGDPYVITTAAQLYEVRYHLDSHFRLGADIDLSGYVNWEPINVFTGTFDGNGFTISNLKINSSAAQVGLFGSTEDAEIRNVGLINVDITGTGAESEVGGLVGYFDESTIEYVYVTGKIFGADNVGGLIGYGTGRESSVYFPSYVRYSYAAAEVTGGSDPDDGIGGLIGKIEGAVVTEFAYYDYNLTPRLPANSDFGQQATTNEMMRQSTFPDWDFSKTGQWGLIEDATYPMHRTTFDRIMLDALTVDGGAVALAPAFDSGVLTYTSRVAGNVDSVTVAVYSDNSNTSISIGGDDSELVPLVPGENIVNIAVSTAGTAVPGADADPFVVTYTLKVIREDGGAYAHSIATADQLANIGTGYYELGDKYTLLSDLDLAAYADWEPIGDGLQPFTGHFDGQHHVIRNLTIRGTDNDIGLFAASSGTIENIGLDNVDVAGESRVGGLIGQNTGTVTNAYVKGAVSGSDRVGGLIGSHSGGGLATNAYFAGTATGTSHVGGLVGENAATVTSSFWDKDRNESIADDGMARTTEEMQLQSTYSEAGWDFAGVWAMMNGTTYPMWKRHYEAAKLSDSLVIPPAGTQSWDRVFSSEQGEYTIDLHQYVTEVDIVATPAESGVTVAVNGTGGSAMPVTSGHNQVEIATTDASGYAKGKYMLNINVPAPPLTGITIPANGYYGGGDLLTFTVTYEGDVDAVGPRLPIVIGSETVYAVYAGQPVGEPNKLRFEYEVPAGQLDSDGIALGAAIDLPVGASITAGGQNAPLAFSAPDSSGIRIDSLAPTIVLSQSPAQDTTTEETVTVTADIADTGSGIALTKWAEGARTAAFFGSGGSLLTEDGFEAASNGTYTVYAQDQAGNEAVQEISITNIRTPSPPSAGGGYSVQPEPCQDGSCMYLRAGEAGEFTVAGMTIVIPEGATDENLTLTIEEAPAPVSSANATNPNYLSPIFEVLKSSPNEFLKPVTLRIDYRSEDVTSGQIASVFFYDEEAEQWVDIGGAAEGDTIAAQVDHFTKFAVLAVRDPAAEPGETPIFTDIHEHWARRQIIEAVSRGIVHGYPDGTFRPDEPVTRAQFAVMAMNALGWKAPNEQPLQFIDTAQIPPWSLKASKAAVQSGFMSGYPDQTLRPNAVMTREETAVMIARALQLPPGKALATSFRDDDAISPWAKPFVAAAQQAGIVQAIGRNAFMPAAGTTRADAVVWLLSSQIASGE